MPATSPELAFALLCIALFVVWALCVVIDERDR